MAFLQFKKKKTEKKVKDYIEGKKTEIWDSRGIEQIYFQLFCNSLLSRIYRLELLALSQPSLYFAKFFFYFNSTLLLKLLFNIYSFYYLPHTFSATNCRLSLCPWGLEPRIPSITEEFFCMVHIFERYPNTQTLVASWRDEFLAKFSRNFMIAESFQNDSHFFVNSRKNNFQLIQ